MKILITGDAGFVGRAFHRYLDDKGHDITGVDILNGIDARDFFRKDDTFYDLVIHLAAIVGGRKMIEGSPLALAVDLAIDAEMFGWALRTKPGHVVYFSSSAAYPIEFQKKPGWLLNENDINLRTIRNPDMTYGWAKLTGEMLARHAYKEGLKVHTFRPFSGYGSDQALDYPFPSFIDRAKRRSDPFEIWGNGEAVRDFIHIDDIVAGVFAGIDAEIEVSNLCTGRGVSFNELAQIVCKQANYSPTFEHLTAEPVGVQYRVGDPLAMNLYYTPKISLEEGIALTLS